MSETNPLKRKIAIGLYLIFSLFSVVSVGVAFGIISLFGYQSITSSSYAYGIGFLSDIFNVLIWVPQIYTTWKLKSPGSLSLLMLLLQAPGTLIVVVFYILDGANWSIWLPFLTNFFTMTILLIEGTIFLFMERRRKKEKTNIQGEEEQKLIS